MKPLAIILPMPREPPVTSAVRPSSENRSVIIGPLPLRRWSGRTRRDAGVGVHRRLRQSSGQLARAFGGRSRGSGFALCQFLGHQLFLRQLADRRLWQARADVHLRRYLILGELVGEKSLELVEGE